MSIDGIGGNNPYQLQPFPTPNAPKANTPNKRENTANAPTQERSANTEEITRSAGLPENNQGAGHEEIAKQTFLPEKTPSPSSLFIGQDFSSVEGTSQKYAGPILSTGRQVPNYEEFKEMEFQDRQFFLKSLTPEEREEYAQKLQASLA